MLPGDPPVVPRFLMDEERHRLSDSIVLCGFLSNLCPTGNSGPCDETVVEAKTGLGVRYGAGNGNLPRLRTLTIELGPQHEYCQGF